MDRYRDINHDDSNCTITSDLHDHSNDPLPIDDNELPRINIDCNDGILANAWFPIDVTPDPIVSEVMAVYWNALLPMDVTELGITRDPVRLEQKYQAKWPMEARREPRDKEDILV